LPKNEREVSMIDFIYKIFILPLPHDKKIQLALFFSYIPFIRTILKERYDFDAQAEKKAVRIIDSVKEKQLFFEERKNYSERPLNDLELFFLNEKHRLICKHSHYFEIYDRHFQKFRDKKITVVEIGIFGGGSLQLWKHYFGKNAHIIGIDINPACKQFEEDQIDIYIGSQEDRNFWKCFLEQNPTIDILIDDGGHTMNQQIVTFEETFDHISEGGVYWCEDCATSYWPSMGGGGNRKGTFIEYTKRFIDYIHAWHSKKKRFKINKYTKNMYGLYYYDQIVCIEKRFHEKTGAVISIENS